MVRLQLCRATAGSQHLGSEHRSTEAIVDIHAPCDTKLKSNSQGKGRTDRTESKQKDANCSPIPGAHVDSMVSNGVMPCNDAPYLSSRQHQCHISCSSRLCNGMFCAFVETVLTQQMLAQQSLVSRQAQRPRLAMRPPSLDQEIRSAPRAHCCV